MKPGYIVITVIMSSLLIALPVTIRCEENGPLTLDKAVRLAFQNEETLLIAGNAIRKARLEKGKAIRALAPDLAFSSGYEYYHRQSGPEAEIEKGDEWGYTVSLNQPLYTGGRATSAMRATESSIIISNQLFELTREEVYLYTARAFFDVLAAQKVLEAGKSGVRQAREFVTLAGTRFELGDATRTSLLRAEFELSRRENELVQAENGLELARENLKKIIGRDFTDIIDEKKDVFTDLDLENRENLIIWSLQRRREILIADEQVKIAREGIVSARGNFLPLLYANGFYSRNGERIPPDDTENWGASINIDIPIYDRGLSISGMKAARLELENTLLEQKQLSKAIRLEVEEKYHNLRGLESAVLSLKKQVELAEENRRGVQKQYEVGLSTDLDVSTALFDLVSAKVQLVKEEYNLAMARLELQKAAGMLNERISSHSTDR